VTAGAGYDRETWEINVGVSRRYGETTITDDELGAGCALCGFAGDYSIGMTGLYLDASVDLDI
jgi:hypothetical protein